MARDERRVGPYDLLDLIGGGGAGVVYLAYQRELRQRVALKELLSEHATGPGFAERFQEQSGLMGAMSHPSIVPVYEFFEHDGIPYIAMEYLPRGSLRRYVGRLSVAQTVGALESVLAGLAHGERQGIVHRNIKPENLLIALDGRVKVADFGVAGSSDAVPTPAVIAGRGDAIGAPTYTAPEQAIGEEPTSASDLYSLGIVACELLTGAVPFKDTDTPDPELDRPVDEPVRRVAEVAPDIDEQLAGWLDRMLARRAADRFQRADPAWGALEDVVIDLLGRHWRREARLGERPAQRGRGPLTPAQFETQRADEIAAAAAPEKAPDESARAEVSSEATGAVAAPGEGSVATEAAAKQSVGTDEPPEAGIPPEASRPIAPIPTMPRPGRAYRPPDEREPARIEQPSRRRAAATARAQRPPARIEKPSRRRAVIAALLVATALAAGAGALIGAMTGRAPSHRADRTTTTNPAATLDRELVGVLGSLATARDDGWARLRTARTARQQADAAKSIAAAYQTAAGRIAALPGSPSALHNTVADLANSYDALAGAAGARSATRLQQAQAQITSQEQQLSVEAGAL